MRELSAFLLAVAMLFTLSSCKPRVDGDSPTDEAKTNIEVTTILTSTTNVPSQTEEESEIEEVPTTTTEVIIELPELFIDETYIVDGVSEFTLLRVELANEIYFKSNSYIGAVDNEDAIRLDFVFSYKNLDKQEVNDMDTAEARLIYSDGYQYDARLVSSDFTILPLMTDTLHVYFEVPKLIFEDDLAIEVYFNFDPSVDSEYQYIFKLDKDTL